MKKIESLKALIAEMESDMVKVEAGTMAAVTRVRKKCQEVKKLCQEIRNEVQELRLSKKA